MGFHYFSLFKIYQVFATYARIITYYFSLSIRNVNISEDIYIYVLCQNPLTVRMYQFLHWVAEPELPSPENTLKLLDHAERWQLRSGHGALCFQCK